MFPIQNTMRILICSIQNNLNMKQERRMMGFIGMGNRGSQLLQLFMSHREARMIFSTGSSQFETFQALLKEDVDWRKVKVFHLDEYIDLPVTNKASFRKYLITDL
jgi:glucosamine-6-phosphate deaminase